MSEPRELIERFWPDHMDDVSAPNAWTPVMDREHGVVCGCGAVLGFPQEEPPEEPEPEELHADPKHNRMRHEIRGRVQAAQAKAAAGLLEPDRREQAADAAQERYDDAQRWAGQPDELPPDEAQQSGTELAQRSSPLTAPESAVVPMDPIVATVDTIDPTQPYTPEQIEVQILDIEQRLSRGEHFLREWVERSARADHAFTMGYARALLAANAATVALREAQATVDTEDLRWAKTEAESMVRAARDCMHTLRAQLSGHQTVSRSINDSMRAASGRGR